MKAPLRSSTTPSLTSRRSSRKPPLARGLRALTLLVWAIAPLALPTAARAQSVSMDGQSFFIERDNERPSSELPNWISRQDCLEASEERYRGVNKDSSKNSDAKDAAGDFTWVEVRPTLERETDDTVEIWVSQTADCSQQSVQDSDSRLCTMVYSESGDNTRVPTYRVNPRDVIEQNSSREYDPNDPPGDDETCNIENRVSLVYHVVLKRGTDIVASDKWEEAGIDTRGPRPPETLRADPGDKTIFFEWDIDPNKEEEDTYGFTFFCVEAGTMATATGGASGGSDAGGSDAGGSDAGGSDAGGSDAGGSDAGGSDAVEAVVTCDQNILVAGQVPSAEALSYKCGSARGKSARDGQAEKVTNDQQYAVAISSNDTVRNSGQLTTVRCVTPKEVTTFYEGYQAAGGKGGGGFCSQGGLPRTSLFLLLLTSLPLMVVRRRRRVSEQSEGRAS